MKTLLTLPPLVRQVAEREQLEVLRVYRDGPRYWAGQVRQKQRRLLLKAVINDSPSMSPGAGVEFRPSDQMQVEIQMFKTLERRRDTMPGPVPDVVACALGQPTWLLRTQLRGRALAIGRGPMIFADELYEPTTTGSLIDFLIAIRGLGPDLAGVVSEAELKHMTREDYTQPVELVAPYAKAAWEYLSERFEFYDAHLDTLTHGQVFPPHVYFINGQVSLIDWEDTRFRSSVHDFVALWLRGFGREAWQDSLLRLLGERGVLATQIQRQLWRIETLVQAYGMLIYFYWTTIETPDQKKLAVESLKRKVEGVLNGSLLE